MSDALTILTMIHAPERDPAKWVLRGHTIRETTWYVHLHCARTDKGTKRILEWAGAVLDVDPRQPPVLKWRLLLETGGRLDLRPCVYCTRHLYCME